MRGFFCSFRQKNAIPSILAFILTTEEKSIKAHTENLLTVVCPGGVWHVDGGILAKEAGIEFERETATTSAGENLGDSKLCRQNERSGRRSEGQNSPIFPPQK